MTTVLSGSIIVACAAIASTVDSIDTGVRASQKLLSVSAPERPRNFDDEVRLDKYVLHCRYAAPFSA